MSKPKKFQVSYPKRCNGCHRKQSCDLKGATLSGIFLDCKSFYHVFCDLEENCRIPYGDDEAMQKYDEESEAGVKPFLTPPLVVNGMLSAELALKYLTFKEVGTFDCVHEIDTLFYALPPNHLVPLSELLKKNACQNDDTLRFCVSQIPELFTKWRYFSKVILLHTQAL